MSTTAAASIYVQVALISPTLLCVSIWTCNIFRMVLHKYPTPPLFLSFILYSSSPVLSIHLKAKPFLVYMFICVYCTTLRYNNIRMDGQKPYIPIYSPIIRIMQLEHLLSASSSFILSRHLLELLLLSRLAELMMMAGDSSSRRKMPKSSRHLKQNSNKRV